MTAFDELMAIRRLDVPTEAKIVVGADPVLATPFSLGETSADILMAIGVAVNDLHELHKGHRQDLEVRVDHAAAAWRSYLYLQVKNSAANDAFARQRER